MKKVVVLTGAGISAESGIKTFRDAGGLWEGHDVMEVASMDGWRKNQDLVLDFYNQRRRQLKEVLPNDAHKALVDLEARFEVTVITQNVDDLHERAGSSHVIHLHGELKKMRSSGDENLVYACDRDILSGNFCEKGYQLRPHIVWFGELVPMMDIAIPLVQQADVLMVIGTSLVVYPAAGLVGIAPKSSPKYLVDPHVPEQLPYQHLTVVEKTASIGVPEVVDLLLKTA